MATLSPVLKQATPVVVDHAEGSWIYGTDGETYLDFTTGIGVTSVSGYAGRGTRRGRK